MTNEELKPCPFCGAKAHFEKGSGGWEWVECESCGMQSNHSASLMEDCKPKLREEWNRRAPALQTQRTQLSEEEIFNIYCKSDSVLNTTSTNLILFARAIESEHGIK